MPFVIMYNTAKCMFITELSIMANLFTKVCATPQKLTAINRAIITKSCVLWSIELLVYDCVSVFYYIFLFRS